MQSGPPRRRRTRPVADAPIDGLLARGEDLAKGWLLALVEDAPLAAAGRVLAGPLADTGPALCAAMLRALRDDRDLARLEPGGSLEPLAATCARAGAGGPEGALRAVDALGSVLWAALRDELRDHEPEVALEVSERLATVLERIRAAALRGGELVDAGPRPDVTPAALRIVPSAPEAVASSVAAPEALWVAALEDEVAHARSTGAPLCLLLVELDEGERLRSAGSAGEAQAAFSRFAMAVRAVLRRQDLLAGESETREWVIARDTGRPGARALAERIDASVRSVEDDRGVPMTVNIGIALLGEDATDAASLLGAAEAAAYAAAAEGVVSVGADELPEG